MTADFALIILILVGLILIAYVCIGVVILVDAMRIRVPFVRTRDHAIGPVIRALKLAPGCVLYDLGCGDAKVLAAASREEPRARYIGIEKGWMPYVLAKMTAPSTVILRREDIRSADISDATHVYVYLLPELLSKIEQKVFSETPSGTRVVSCDFRFPTKEPVAHLRLSGRDSLARELFIYTT